MVKYCSVFGCQNSFCKDSPISFHSFPKDTDLRENWVRNISRLGKDGKLWQPSEYSTVCSDHFLPSDFHFNGEDVGRKILLSKAIPSIFKNHPHHKQIAVQKRRPLKRIAADLPCGTSPGKKVKSSFDHAYFAATPNIQNDLEKTKKKLKNVLKKNKNLKRQVKRKNEKISNLLEQVKDLNMIQQSHVDLLNLNFGENTLTLIENELNTLGTHPQGLRYSENLKSFAVTLHFYSAQAYDYLRKYLRLPHPATIRKWASSINCEPGYLSEVFTFLKRKLDTDPKMKDVVLMFDGMAIKREYTYDTKLQKYCGTVNYGHIQVGASDTLATEVLVLLVVGIRGHWKQPIGYFLTNHMSSGTQAQLIKDGLILLHESGFSVHSVVCDGSYTNQATATSLGCVLSADLKNTFPHPCLPDTPVYFIFDVCHLIKCVRNCLAELGVLKYNSTRIEWNYIAELNKIQMNDNLNLVNKVKAKHINFQRHKMNVKLAVQTLSSSVADAIDFLREDMKLIQFEGSEPTTKFIRLFDKLFDVCNSHNPYGKGFKKPLFGNNFKSFVDFLSSVSEYIINLTDVAGNKLISSKRKTAFLGFMCSSKSIKEVSEKLLFPKSSGNEPFKYVLTYKFSQDHLEMLFSRIRRRGGWNNNPNCLQFKWALRTILMKNGIQPSDRGNSVEPALLSVEEPVNTVFTAIEKSNATLPKSSLELNKKLDRFSEIIKKPTIWHNHVLFYIAGYIARKLSLTSKCAVCSSILQEICNEHSYSYKTPENFSELTRRKDRGGLVTPSRDMFKVVICVDNVVREFIAHEGAINAVSKSFLPKVQVAVRSRIRQNVFKEYDDHFTETSKFPQEDDHGSQMLNGICKIFVTMIVHHHKNIINERYVKDNQTSRRHKLTKTILFLHE